MAEYPDDPDGDALAQLEQLGVNLTKPLLLEFTVDAPNERAAEALQQALDELGYQSHVEYDDGEPNEAGEDDEDDLEDEEIGPSWTVYVEVTMVPSYAEVVRIQRELDRVAEPLGGSCDGWGTMVDESE